MWDADVRNWLELAIHRECPRWVEPAWKLKSIFPGGSSLSLRAKTNMSSQLGTVTGLLLKAKWEKFLALRKISEFSHSLGRARTFPPERARLNLEQKFERC